MNRFKRFISLIGENKYKNIVTKSVMIIGLGGVGGHALEAIVRSGISKIIIVDFDKIDITNLNRQIISNTNNIGKKKVDVAEERIKSINENCEVIKYDLFVSNDNIDTIFNHNIDYVIDACDNINAKKRIIEKCLFKKIKFISSMGMGNKFDPLKITICDIRKTSYDKLAKILRDWIKKENINDKITVVSSSEQPKKVEEVIGSNSYVPSVAGIMCASYVINDIIKKEN